MNWGRDGELHLLQVLTQKQPKLKKKILVLWTNDMVSNLLKMSLRDMAANIESNIRDKN